ncbi:MAG TPA: hypothetical protein VJH33_02735 [Candidatus Paceibacterota bacterium]
MLAFALMAVMIAAPLALWVLGLHQIAVVIGIVIILCVPSMAYTVYVAIKQRALPTIINGPRLTWAGRSFHE